MAIENDIVVAVGPRADGVVHIANIQTERYPERVFHVDRMPTVDPAQHDWTNYVLAAYQVSADCKTPQAAAPVSGDSASSCVLGCAAPAVLPISDLNIYLLVNCS